MQECRWHFFLMLIRMIQDFVRTISEMKELGQEEA